MSAQLQHGHHQQQTNLHNNTEQQKQQQSETSDDKFEAIKQCASAIFEQQTRNLAQTAEMQVILQALQEREKDLRQRHHTLQSLAAQLDSDITMSTQRNAERRSALLELDNAISLVHSHHGQLQGSIQHIEGVTAAVDAFVTNVFDDDAGVVSTFLQLPSSTFSNLPVADLRTIAADIRKMTSCCCTFIEEARTAAQNIPTDGTDAVALHLTIEKHGAAMSALCDQFRNVIDAWTQRNSDARTLASVGGLIHAPTRSLLDAFRALSAALPSDVQSRTPTAEAMSGTSSQQLRQHIDVLIDAFCQPNLVSAAWHDVVRTELLWLDTYCQKFRFGGATAVFRAAEDTPLKVSAKHVSDAMRRVLASTTGDETKQQEEEGGSLHSNAVTLVHLAQRLTDGLAASSALEQHHRVLHSQSVAQLASTEELAQTSALHLQDAQEQHNAASKALADAETSLERIVAAIVASGAKQTQTQNDLGALQEQLIHCQTTQGETVARALCALDAVWGGTVCGASASPTENNGGGVDCSSAADSWNVARMLEWDSIELDNEAQRLSLQLRDAEEALGAANAQLHVAQRKASIMVSEVDVLVAHVERSASDIEPFLNSNIGTTTAEVEPRGDENNVASTHHLLATRIDTLKGLPTTTCWKDAASSVYRLSAEILSLETTNNDLLNEYAALETLLASLHGGLPKHHDHE